MVQESATEVSPSISTGTFSELCGAIASFSVKHQGIDSADSPLCASAIRVRQQNGLNGRCSSVPTSSKSFNAISKSRSKQLRHCEKRSDEAIQPSFAALLQLYGLLRFARNDGHGEMRAVFYFTTAAVWPNNSLRSSSVRIAGWP